jgi:hypothetical protein
MREFIIKIVIWVTLLIISILLVVFQTNFETRLEVRNGFLFNLVSGAFTFWIFFILLAIVFWDINVHEFIRFRLIRYLLSQIIVCINVIVFILAMFATFSSPNVKKDAIVYENRFDSHEKIICEFWETGITGNGNWRIVETSRQNFFIRPIRVISDTALRNELILGEYPSEFIPKTNFKFQNITFELNR